MANRSPNPDRLTLDVNTIPLQPKRWRYVLDLILKRHNWQHAVKAKGVSHKTQEERARFCIWLFEFLRSHPRKTFKLDPRSFSGRHVDVLMAYWQAEAKAGRLQPATLQTYYSFLKTFTRWIGRSEILKPLPAYFDDAALYRRSYCAEESKSWHERGINVEEMIREVEAYDTYAAASLWLMRAFGLRFKEACMLRPHADVVSAAQANRPDEQVEFYLNTHRGTKGGRQRYVPVDSEVRRHAVAYAQQVVRGPQASVSDQSRSLVQAMRRLRYVMERHGITKADLGVVPHGLRHQSASEVYTKMTGVKPPVHGGESVDPDIDLAARKEIAEQLGHGREQIVNAYCGKRVP